MNVAGGSASASHVILTVPRTYPYMMLALARRGGTCGLSARVHRCGIDICERIEYVFIFYEKYVCVSDLFILDAVQRFGCGL